MRILFILLLAAAGGAVWAQTTAADPKHPRVETTVQTTEIFSDSAMFDDNVMRMVYIGHVLVVDPKLHLRCERLTVDLPPSGRHTNQLSGQVSGALSEPSAGPASGRPKSVVAETNVVIDFIDDKGFTNHVTSAKAVYTNSVVNAVTNELITFTGNPLVDTPKGTIASEPLVWDVAANQFYFYSYHMVLHQSLTAEGTNGGSNKLY